MPAKLYSILICLLLTALILPVQAQSIKRNKLILGIDSLATAKRLHQQTIRDIDSISERLKLKRIRLDLDLNGIASCDEDKQVIHHASMSIGYNEQHEQANWVAHIVTRDIAEGSVRRTNDFRVDPAVESGTPVTSDYWESGYDRGHLAPSADFRWSKTALSESYFYSNMSPQLPEFNRGIWAEVENKVREWSILKGELYVVTGGILEDGLKTIGDSNQVSIPKKYYKVLLDYRSAKPQALGLLLEHKGYERKIDEFFVSVDSIEKLSGVDFFPAIEDNLEEQLESAFDSASWPLDVFGERKLPIKPLAVTRGQVTAPAAKYYIGDKCTVCGTVVATKHIKNGTSDPTYINLDDRFPNQIFTVVIYGRDRMNFTYEPEQYLKGRRICVKGRVGEYKSTPQMVIKDEHKIWFYDEKDDW